MANEKNNEKYPGYPHYAPSEDITEAKNNNGKESLDTEPGKPVFNDTVDQQDEDQALISRPETDITDDDIRTLEAAEQNMDTIDDINLQRASLDNVDDDGDLLNEESSLNRDMTGEDLDVPGIADDDADENVGDEDEENNYYSLGGDLHESQEENKGE